LLVKGETTEQCLQRYPEYADELKPLLATALSINKLSAVEPRPEFRDRARHQFYSALQKAELKKSRPLFGWAWQPRWAVTVAIALFLVLAGGGTVVASGNSMPDEPLYTVKLATEQVQLFFTRSTVSRAELYAKLADKRVAEIVSMADENKPAQIAQATERLDTYLTKIADLASNQGETEGIAMAPATERAFAMEEEEEEMAPPAEETAEWEVAPAPPPVEEAPVLSDVVGEAKATSVEGDSRARLRATVTRYAANHPERLRAALAKVPQSTKAALQRAIAISETGYEKILESLD